MKPTSSPNIPIGLKSIKIENFRGIDSLELSFLDAFGNASDIVVLGGPNGCGKTTVLEGCLLVAGHPHLLRGPDNLRAGFRLVAEMQNSQHAEGHYILDSDKINFWHSDNFLPSYGVPCLYFSAWRTPRLVGSLPISVGKQLEGIDDTEVNRLQLAKQFFVNGKFHSLMRSGKKATENGRSAYEETIDRLNDVWRTLYPDAVQQFTVEPVSEDPDAGFDVFLSGADGVDVPVDGLGSGQLELFTLFGSLLRLKFSEGLLVIDEPELHLDPQWHAVLFRALRRLLPKVQFIVATHSPRVYDSVLSFQSFFLLPDDDPRARAWQTHAESGREA
jgi:energy-coupling factor transporter ATP-binding protein EcfA2